MEMNLVGFLHAEITGENFECNLCDEKLSNHLMFLKHRKMQHEHAVPHCRNYSDGSCRYSKGDCWFQHSKNSDENKDNENENSEYENIDKEVIQKLFKMMENFTEQMTKMKEINQLL